MSRYCEALGDFLIEFFRADRFKGTADYDRALQTIALAFSYDVPYDALVIYMMDNNIPLKASNIIKLLNSEGYKPVNFSNDEEEYNFICKNVFKFLAGLLGIPKLKNKKERTKYGSVLASLLSVDTNWNAVWTLFFSRGGYNLRSLAETVLDVVFDEMGVPLRKVIRAVKIKKEGRNNYTLVIKVTRDYMKIVDARTHSKLKEKLGRILIEL